MLQAKKEIPKENFEVLVDITYLIDTIKGLANRIRGYNSFTFDNGNDKKIYEMPDLKTLWEQNKKPVTIFDLKESLLRYIDLVPEKEKLQELDFDMISSKLHGNACYNEIDLYEADEFLIILTDMLKDYEGKKYYVDLYDLNDYSIGFWYKKTAEDFMAEYGSPCTLFKTSKKFTEEIYSI